MNDNSKTAPRSHTDKPRFARTRFAMKIVLPLIILGAGLVGASYLKKTGPKPQKRTPQKMTALVQVLPLERSNENVVVQAMGTVIPAREMVLKPRVSGEIVEIHPEFTEGGFLKAGEQILRIDAEDYELDIVQKKSKVTASSYSLKLELGHQDVAKREWELLNEKRPANTLDTELALRKPHLKKARADLEAARADLRQAQLNLNRTRVRAPFNAIVRTKYVEKGVQVSAQEKLADLVGTDEYRIQVSVPIDRLRWIMIPHKKGDSGSSAHVRYGGGHYERTGTVVKLLSDLETDGRMARILISVPDPLDMETPDGNRPPLLIGEYVQVDIQGQEVDNVFHIPRTALRDNVSVWIAKADGTLSIRQVDTVWRDSESVLIRDGLENGENLIISDLAAPIEGMLIRVSD